MAWAEDPPSRTRHLITNIEVETGSTDAEILVYSNFLVYRSRGETEQDFFVGSGGHPEARGGRLENRAAQNRPRPERAPAQNVSIFF
jgi:3-phenylpropionate/cinnamic acid dioxygenase small subunit